MRARSALVLALLTGAGVSCSVGPGGSFPDTGGSASVSTTLAAGTNGTASSGGSSETSGESTADPQDDETSAEQGTASVDAESSGATNAEGDTTGNASAETGGSAESDPASSSDGGDSAQGTPLDPDLDIPEKGEQCNDPGNLVECPGIAVCRFATAEYGLCESCDSCGNLDAPCTQGTECDILFSCYAGRCTNFCTLGTFECGPIEDCLDIGHPTDGVCNPFA